MSVKQKKVLITSAVRTAIGSFKGSLKDMQAHDLGSIVVKECIKRSKLNSNEIDELIMGQVLTGAAGQNTHNCAGTEKNEKERKKKNRRKRKKERESFLRVTDRSLSAVPMRKKRTLGPFYPLCGACLHAGEGRHMLRFVSSMPVTQRTRRFR